MAQNKLLRRIDFCAPAASAFFDRITAAIDAGAESIAFHGSAGAELDALKEQVALAYGQQVRLLSETESIALAGDVAVFLETDPDRLSAGLLAEADRHAGWVIAPETENFWNRRPLFMISIPKAGTHLLERLVAAFGYAKGVEWGDGQPVGGTWYCLLGSNSHTVARDFFVESVRLSPHGNRHHIFPRTPTLFIYRHPLDILVSEANYYHKSGATLFADYFRGMTPHERQKALFDDNQMLGGFRNRILGFAPWLKFGNVIPVSFEELIGQAGGGENRILENLIWSLQLKLHIPGGPQDFSSQVYDPTSPTFHKGKIGSFADQLAPAILEQVIQDSSGFLEVFGYSADPDRPALSRHTSAFRRRALALAQDLHHDTPIQIKTNYFAFNIVLFQDRHWVIPIDSGAFDLAALSPEARADIRHFADMNEAKRYVLSEVLSNETAASQANPQVIAAIAGYNILRWRDRYVAVRQGHSPDWSRRPLELLQEHAGHIIFGTSEIDIASALSQKNDAATPHPHMLGAIGNHNILMWQGRYVAVRHGLAVDWDTPPFVLLKRHPDSFFIANTEIELLGLVAAQAHKEPPAVGEPVLIGTINGFNILQWGAFFVGLQQGLTPDWSAGLMPLMQAHPGRVFIAASENALLVQLPAAPAKRR